MKLVGKVALVTGAGKGIGKAIALLLAQNGAAIAINAYHQESASAACQELLEAGFRAMAVPADVGNQKAVNRMVDKVKAELGPIDILVNNAAAPAEFVLFEVSTPGVQHQELITFLGVLHCTRPVLPGMISRRRGRIINISSLAARHASPGRAIYSGANAGIEAFTKSLSCEVGRHGITVNCVSPGAVDSPRFKARSEEVRSAHRKAISLDRFGEPEEIAQAVLFLASDMSNYITGAVLDVDGGFCGHRPLK